MKITANQDFRHGRDQYVAGEDYEVPDALAGYFVGNGWADPDQPIPGLERTTPPAVVDIAPHSSTHEHDATEG